MANTQQPAFTAFAVSKRGENQEDWWTPIGAAFPHKDGQGFNVVLQTIPLAGKIVLRPPKDKNEGAESVRTEQGSNSRPRENAKPHPPRPLTAL
jgi:hypothetical protein